MRLRNKIFWEGKFLKKSVKRSSINSYTLVCKEPIFAG